MRRVIVAALATVFVMTVQAWAAPVDVGYADLSQCSGGCQAALTPAASRGVAEAPPDPGGTFQEQDLFSVSGPDDASVPTVPLTPAAWLFLAGLVGMCSLSKMRKRSRTNEAFTV